MPKQSLWFAAALLMLSSAGPVLAQNSLGPLTGSRFGRPSQSDGQILLQRLGDSGTYLGVTTTDMTRDSLGKYHLRELRGAIVTSVIKDSPADKAGLKTDDVILNFDGEPVTSARKLGRMLEEATPEQTVKLVVSRGGAEQTLTATLGRRGDYSLSMNSMNHDLEGFLNNAGGAWKTESARQLFTIGNWNNRRIGISTTKLTDQLAEYFGAPDKRGLLVNSVEENSPASKAGIKAGDVITEADHEKLYEVSDLGRIMNQHEDGAVSLSIVRNKNQMTVTVTPEKSQGLRNFRFPFHEQ